jgi:hypothetical protein
MFIYFYGIQSWLLIRAISLVDFLINSEIMTDNVSQGVVQFPASDVSMLRLHHDWSGFNRALSCCSSCSVHSFVLGIVQHCYCVYPWNHDNSSLRANDLCVRDFRLSKRCSWDLLFFGDTQWIFDPSRWSHHAVSKLWATDPRWQRPVFQKT